jgi:DNA-directed RNA polymerase I subunit RPA43
MASDEVALAAGAPVEKKEKKERRSKREKGDHKSKKRHLEAESEQDAERKHKRSKSIVPPEDDLDASHVKSRAGVEVEEAGSARTEKREKRRKNQSSQLETEDTAMTDLAAQVEPDLTEGNTKSEPTNKDGTGKRGKKSKIHKTHQGSEAEAEDQKIDAPLASETDKGLGESQADATNEHEVEKSEKKVKKHKKHQNDQAIEAAEESADVANPSEATSKEEKRKRKEERKREKERKKQASVAQNDEEAMDIDSPTKGPSAGTFGELPDKPFPFFRQTVAQYLPLFPQGLIEPIEGYAEQHLKPLLNRYVPTLKGVLLGYRKVRIGEAPGKSSLTEDSAMSDEVLLESIDEYAVTFGWLTAEVDLFKPARGAWLEGTINLQTEGHLGVVCWGMFNASIEAGRLPSGWRWIDLLGKEGRGADGVHLPTPDPFEEGADDVEQVHVTGYWVDEKGQRVRGTLRFRVKNYEVGTSGDYGYLSIEGTMLDEGAERKKGAEEREAARRSKLRHGGLLRKERKRMPEFSMTKFGADEEQEDEQSRAEIWKGSRPASESAE